MTDLDLTSPVELVVVSVEGKAMRCRLTGGDCIITLRSERSCKVVPGEIATVMPRRQWRYAGTRLSGEILSTRFDVAVLGLVPLRLEPQGAWDPREEFWGEEGEPLDDWARRTIAWGPRMAFEMEQVLLLPIDDPDDPDGDPIIRSNDLKDAGDPAAARRILMELCEADLRCLDAHAHLGNLVFDRSPVDAIRH